jgi:hypothetical protein
MSKPKTTSTSDNGELELDYVNMPQNDKEQLEQIAREYAAEPAKGLAHGVQKDAIQNAFGARAEANEVKACKGGWRCKFELTTIKGKDALVFCDEGTTGLTGDILSADEIRQRSAESLLGRENANQRLARFLTRFESGGNLGPGSFGRGKLIFQAASRDYSILVDSFRSDDNEYIAFDRLIQGTELRQQRIPFRGDKAREFIKQQTGGALQPSQNFGTRITILNVKQEIIDAFKASFTDTADKDGYSESFSGMIQETWWEILQFGARITLKLKTEERQVVLSGQLRSILEAEEKRKKFRAYTKKNLAVVVGTDVHRIKHLRFVVSPEPVDDELREIWVQRKRMKIGPVSRGISVHPKIQKYFTGYVILDPGLEDLFEAKESTTHYGFDMRGGGGAIGQVRAILRSHLEAFHQQLGLQTESNEARARQDMLDTLKELNEQADLLGLPTEFASGASKKSVEVRIKSITLPAEGTPRIELGDTVGPIVYEVANNTSSAQLVNLEVTGEQRNRADVMIDKRELELPGNTPQEVPVTFTAGKRDYLNREGLLIRARVLDRKSNQQVDQVSRMLWVGMDPPDRPAEPLTIVGYAPLYPRPNTTRVELGESIRGLRFRVSNNVAVPLVVNLDMVVRKAKSPSEDIRVLQSLMSFQGLELAPLSDRDFAVEEIKISGDIFSAIFDKPADARERKCEVFFSVRAAANYPAISKSRGEYLGPRKTVPFYCGIDPAGMSIFRDCRDGEDAQSGKRSWVSGNKAEGYVFVLNVKHPAFDLAFDSGGDFRGYYIKEQMLLQAYTIAVEEGIFRGAAEGFEEKFSHGNVSPADAVKHVDEMVGIAMKKLY